ncbi:MAG: ABC transporter substrate-binding protein [Alphaproteobacteria bacterium]
MNGSGFSRRDFLKGSAAAAATAMAPGLALAQAKGQAQAKGRFVARIERDIINIDPANRISTVEANICRATYQTLARFKPGSLEWEPDAAATIKQVDANTIEFALKPNQKFAGGYGAMTAEDVQFSFMRFTDPAKKVANAGDWMQLDKVEVTGPLSGRILLKTPAPALWKTTICDASGCIVSKKAYEALGDKIATQAMGSGAYVQREWVPGQRFVMTANGDYSGPKPAFGEIELRPITDDKAADAAFRGGETDFTRVSLASFGEVSKLPDTATIRMDGMDTIWIGMNVQKAPFDNVKVRQAIRVGIDVNAILTAAWAGQVKRAKTLIPPQISGSWNGAPLYARSAASAQRMLKEAGAGGFKTRLTIMNTETHQTVAKVVQANLAEIGIECAIQALDSDAYVNAGKDPSGKDLELSLQTLKGKFDPSFYTQWFTSAQIGMWNWQRWSNAEFDKLHTRAAQTNNPTKRMDAFVRMQQLMDESAAFVWLTHDTLTFASRNWLRPALLPNGNDWQLPFFRQV